MIYIGTSGYYYNWWKGIFYPNTPKLNMLKYYAKYYNTVEINNTYYKLPTIQNTLKLKEAITQNKKFIFSIKVNQYITHYKKLKNIKSSFEKFIKGLSPIKNQMGVLLFQFSKNFKLSDKIFSRLIKLAKLVKAFRDKKLISNKTRLAFEFRNSTFYNNKLYNLFKLNNWTFVVWHGKNINFLDTNKLSVVLDYFKDYIDSSNILYIRLHGTKDIYQGAYLTKELQILVDFIDKMNKINQYQNIYIYFNNVDINTEALNNANKIKDIIEDYHKH